MGIGVQREACGEVTEHAGHGLDVYTTLQGDSCEGVAGVIDPSLPNASYKVNQSYYPIAAWSTFSIWDFNFLLRSIVV